MKIYPQKQKVRQSRVNILSNAKLAKKLPKTVKLLPNRLIFAKSGHTEKERR